jgi:hypothetical protein
VRQSPREAKLNNASAINNRTKNSFKKLIVNMTAA